MKEFKLQKELFEVDQTDHKLVVEAEQAAKSPKFTNSNGGLGLAAERASSSCRERASLATEKTTPALGNLRKIELHKAIKIR